MMEALAIAGQVRRAAESVFKRSKVLSGRCMLLSTILAEQLHLSGIKAELVGGEYLLFVDAVMRPAFGNPEHIRAARAPYVAVPHCWVQIDGSIVDITATQFDEELPAVFVTDSSNPHYRKREVCKTSSGRIFIELYGLQDKARRIVAQLESSAIAWKAG